MDDTSHSQKGFLLGVFAGAKPFISAVSQEFLIVGDATEHERIAQETFDRRQDEIKLGDGILTREQISRPINSAGFLQAALAAQKRKAERQDELFYQTILNQMRERIIELENQMAESYEILRGKHGDNVIGGMASAFLSEEKLAGLETDEQKLRALADQFLDENGEIKEQYQHLEEAKYVRDWNELQKLEPIVAQYDGRNDLTAEEKQEVLEAAQAVSLTDNKNKIALSDNSVYQNVVNEKLDEDTVAQKVIKTNSDLGFS